MFFTYTSVLLLVMLVEIVSIVRVLLLKRNFSPLQCEIVLPFALAFFSFRFTTDHSPPLFAILKSKINPYNISIHIVNHNNHNTQYIQSS